MAIERLSVILELVSGNYKKEARDAANATGQIGNSAKTVTGQIGAMLGPAAIGGAIIGLGRMAVKAGENADRLFDLAAQTGLSTDALQEWEFVAKTAGANTEVFADAVKAVIRNLSETEGATGNAAKAYDTLGIAVLDASGNLRDAGSITDEVFGKLAGMENITARNALAQDIFGKKWEETISILDLGTEALGNLREEGKGAVVSAEALRNSDKFRETWQKFTATIGPKLNEILGDLAPLMTDIAEGVSAAVDEIVPFVDLIVPLIGHASDLRDQVDDLSESSDGLGRSFGMAFDSMINPLNAWDTAWRELMALFAETPAVVGEVHDSWTVAAAGIAAAEVTLAAAVGPTIALLDRQWTSHRNVAKAADTQRAALINLFTAQADLLDPVRSVILLTKEKIEADKRLVTVQGDSKASFEDLALAVIEAEQAELRLNSAGAAMSADQIQAFSQLLVRELGYSEEAALELLETLGLVDAFEVNVRVNFEIANANLLEAISSVSGGDEISIRDIQVRQHGGPVRRGQPYIVGEAGPEWMIPDQSGVILPNGMGLGGSVSYVTNQGSTIVVQSPMREFRSDMQYATILASVTNLVEGF